MGDYPLPDRVQQWSDWLAAGLHGRNRWRLAIVLVGVLFGVGRRTVTAWLGAAGAETDYRAYYYFLYALGRRIEPLAARLVALVLVCLPFGPVVQALMDDSPTPRYGPHVQGAGIHRNPTPGPAHQRYVYGHVWVTLAVVAVHPLWDALALPLRAALYVRQKDIAPLTAEHGVAFQTKLTLAVQLTLWLAQLLKHAGKRLELLTDGAYAKGVVLRACRRAQIAVISRLPKKADLFDLPRPPRDGRRGRGRPRIYGTRRLDLAKRAAHPGGWQTIPCQIYGVVVPKTVKTFLATWRPAGGVIRVVLLREATGVQFFFSTNPEHTAQDILESFARRFVIEQVFHDVKQIWGAGQQQVRNYWSNVACWHLCLWLHTLVELWAWDRPHEELVDRSRSPWDDATRRPSHADRRNALRRWIIEEQLTAVASRQTLPPEILHLVSLLSQLAV